jgi:uncharacterized protein YxeA
MLNTKFIKIIITILITMVVVFAFIFIQKSQTPAKGGVGTESPTIENRVIFNTNSTSSSVSTQPEKNVNITEYREGGEDVRYNQINKILLNWNITKEPELLRQALILSRSADNEAILESWRPFMSKNSSDLIKTIDTSTDMEQARKDIYLIFQWYIELSGEYQTLTPSKKTEIQKQYNQLK